MATLIFQRFRLFALLALLVFSIALIIAEDKKPELSELSKLKVENLRLKAQLSKCNSDLTNYQLGQEQTQLQESFRKELNASEKDNFDWGTLSFNPPPTDKK